MEKKILFSLFLLMSCAQSADSQPVKPPRPPEVQFEPETPEQPTEDITPALRPIKKSIPHLKRSNSAHVSEEFNEIVGNTNLSEKKDEFGSSTIKTLIVLSDTQRDSILLRKTIDGIQVMFNTGSTIFPEEAHIKEGYNECRIEFKFDGEESATVTLWRMPIANYETAIYQGNTESFKALLFSSNRLALALSKTGRIARFNLSSVKGFVEKFDADLGELLTNQPIKATPKPVSIKTVDDSENETRRLARRTLDLTMFIMFLALVLGGYFLPTIIGCRKKCATSVFVLNLFLGWTLIGWVVALSWAVYPDEKAVKA